VIQNVHIVVLYSKMKMILKKPVQDKHQMLLLEEDHLEVYLEAVHPAAHLEAAHLEAAHLEAVHPAAHPEAVHPAAHPEAVHPAAHLEAAHPEAVHPAAHLKVQEDHLRQNHHLAKNLDHRGGQKVGLQRVLSAARLDE
jgi:hypothetical protein